MSEFKGTKGEWFSCCTNAKPHFLFADNGETTICSFYQKQDDGTILNIEEVRANAKLIACAPEMLECIKDLLKELSYHGFNNSSSIYIANDLIKKATE